MNNELMYAEVPIVDFEVCKSSYSSENINLYKNKICAGIAGKDSCQVIFTFLDLLIVHFYRATLEGLWFVLVR
jgi:hypothetical protein